MTPIEMLVLEINTPEMNMLASTLNEAKTTNTISINRSYELADDSLLIKRTLLTSDGGSLLAFQTRKYYNFLTSSIKNQLSETGRKIKFFRISLHLPKIIADVY